MDSFSKTLYIFCGSFSAVCCSNKRLFMFLAQLVSADFFLISDLSLIFTQFLNTKCTYTYGNTQFRLETKR